MAERITTDEAFWTDFERSRLITPPTSVRHADRVVLGLWTMFRQSVEYLRGLEEALNFCYPIKRAYEDAYRQTYALAHRLAGRAPSTVDGARVRATAVFDVRCSPRWGSIRPQIEDGQVRLEKPFTASREQLGRRDIAFQYRMRERSRDVLEYTWRAVVKPKHILLLLVLSVSFAVSLAYGAAQYCIASAVDVGPASCGATLFAAWLVAIVGSVCAFVLANEGSSDTRASQTKSMPGLFRLMSYLPFSGVFTGEVISQSDIFVRNGLYQITLQIKKGNGRLYVLFGSVSFSRSEYIVFEANEFEEFTAVVSKTASALRSRPP